MGKYQGGGGREGGFRGGNGGGRSSFPKKSWGNDRDGDRHMHKATCAECGKICEVPFRPTGDKPVYCSDCFSSKRGADDRAPRRDFGDRPPRRDFNDRPAPRADFSRSAALANDDMKKQLGEISLKLDRLANAVEKLTTVAQNAPGVKMAEIVKTEMKKLPSLKAVIKKAVSVKAPAKKKVAGKKK